MKYRSCGETGLKLSVVSLGCWSFGGGDYWGRQDQLEVEQVVMRALELGVNYFDTAEGYNDGRSEESLGRAIRDVPREKIVIGTKLAPSNAYPYKVRESCERSLRRLDQEYIDIYMVHWPIHIPAIKFHTSDPQVLNSPPQAPAAFETLLELQEEGKIRHIGVSNFGKGPLHEALSTASNILVNQLAYSLISRAIEWSILPYCQKMGVGVLAYMPLWQGLLTNAVSSLYELPGIRRRTRHFNAATNPMTRHGEPGAEVETEELLQSAREVADRLDIPLAQLALNWSFAHPGIVSSVVGARNVKQLETNLKSVELNVSTAIIEELNAMSRPLMEKLGPSFDYFEGTENDRTQYKNGTIL